MSLLPHLDSSSSWTKPAVFLVLLQSDDEFGTLSNSPSAAGSDIRDQLSENLSKSRRKLILSSCIVSNLDAWVWMWNKRLFREGGSKDSQNQQPGQQEDLNWMKLNFKFLYAEIVTYSSSLCCIFTPFINWLVIKLKKTASHPRTLFLKWGQNLALVLYFL